MQSSRAVLKRARIQDLLDPCEHLRDLRTCPSSSYGTQWGIVGQRLHRRAGAMKVLVAARLSVLHDGETGLDSQEREVIQWAERHGHEVVGIAADHKTGKSHLWDRPKLRPWVTDPGLLAQYDAIVALKVDR